MHVVGVGDAARVKSVFVSNLSVAQHALISLRSTSVAVLCMGHVRHVDHVY
jgi:hypothetical protein